MEKDYDVLCTLGEGAFGKVYKARHRRSGDEVAVKQIKIGSSCWEEACRSTELQALKALRHPFIVKLKELIRGQKDGSLYYIFEFLGSDLCQLLKYNPNGLEETRAAILTRQLFAGLTHMHQHGFFHRDIKPENILLDSSTETIRIADLGQARSLRALPPFTEYVGTRWYRAPECILRDRSYSSPVDIWAIGLIFAELLRGSPVFCGNSSIDQLYKIFTVLGPPNDWPDFARLAQAMRFRVPDRSCGVARVLPQGTSKCAGFLSEILVINPRRRPIAKKCIEHVYFSSLPTLDLDRLDVAQSQVFAQSQISQSSRVDFEQVESPSRQPSPEVFDDFGNDNRSNGDTFLIRGRSKEIYSRTTSKESVVSVCDQLAKDLDLDAELDAILGDVGNEPDNYSRPSPPTSPPKRAGNRSSSLPVIKPSCTLSQSRSYDSMPTKKAFAAPRFLANDSIEPSKVTSMDDHLDRLLESLDIEEVEKPTVVAAKIEAPLPLFSPYSSECDDEARKSISGAGNVDVIGLKMPFPRSSCLSECNAEIHARKPTNGLGVGHVRPASAKIRTSCPDLRKPIQGTNHVERSERDSLFLQQPTTKPQIGSFGFGLGPPITGNESLRENLGSRGPCKALDFRNASIAGADMDDRELSGIYLNGKAWLAEEAKRLRKIVKATIKEGIRDKTVLWSKVSLELGTGRTAKECKLQYAHDYKAHKTKAGQDACPDIEAAT